MAVATVTRNVGVDAMRLFRSVTIEGTQDQFLRSGSITDPGAGDITVSFPSKATAALEFVVSLRKQGDDTEVDSVGLAQVADEWETRTATLEHPGGYDVYVAIHPSNSGTSQTISVSMPIGCWYDATGLGHARHVIPLESDGALAAFAPEVAPSPTLDGDATAWSELEVTALAAADDAAATRSLIDIIAAANNASRMTVDILVPGETNTELQQPNGLTPGGSTSGAYTDVDESPDSPDAAAVTIPASSDALFSFPTPTSNPTTGADLQTFRMWVKWNGGGVATFWLAESGSTITLIGDASTLAIGTSYEMISLTWNASDLGTADGSAVELYVTCNASAQIDIDALEWIVDLGTLDSALRFTHYDGAVTAVAQTVDADSTGADWIAAFTARARQSLCGLWEDRTKFTAIHYSDDDYATSTGTYGRSAAWTLTLGNDPYDEILIGHSKDTPDGVTRQNYFTGGIARVRIKSRDQSLYPPPAAVTPLDDSPDEVAE